jgi:peptidoglycan/xylan/chitin deacetylase (PgdA/CDA1 family)
MNAIPAAASASRVCLTFDDGPDTDWTPRVLDILAAAQVQATFFMIGRQVRRWPELARRVAAAGHEVANHTFSHRHPWWMSTRAARSEVRDGTASLSDALGVQARFYRAPHGRRRRCMTEEAHGAGQAVASWNRSAIDWGMLGSAQGIARRLERVADGTVLLMHDGRNQHNRPDQLVQVLPQFLAQLASRGLRSSKLDQPAFAWALS